MDRRFSLLHLQVAAGCGHPLASGLQKTVLATAPAEKCELFLSAVHATAVCRAAEAGVADHPGRLRARKVVQVNLILSNFS